MERIFIFRVEVPYSHMNVEKALQLWKKGFKSKCDGDKKSLIIKFIFKEVKFSV